MLYQGLTPSGDVLTPLRGPCRYAPLITDR